jgi:hypothetical protein
VRRAEALPTISRDCAAGHAAGRRRRRREPLRVLRVRPSAAERRPSAGRRRHNRRHEPVSEAADAARGRRIRAKKEAVGEGPYPDGGGGVGQRSSHPVGEAAHTSRGGSVGQGLLAFAEPARRVLWVGRHRVHVCVLGCFACLRQGMVAAPSACVCGPDHTARRAQSPSSARCPRRRSAVTRSSSPVCPGFDTGYRTLRRASAAFGLWSPWPGSATRGGGPDGGILHQSQHPRPGVGQASGRPAAGLGLRLVLPDPDVENGMAVGAGARCLVMLITR